MDRALLAATALVALAALTTSACSKSAASDAPKPDAAVAVTTPPDEDAGPCTSADFAGSPLGVHCNALVDSSGRTVLLRGINTVVEGVWDDTFTDGTPTIFPLIQPFAAADAQRIRALGFNAIRLPVQWSAIEPTEDGGVATSYFDAIAAVTSTCAAAGLWVLIDLHQDDYSKFIGDDGAPLWAIQPPPPDGGPYGPSSPAMSTEVENAYATFFGDPNAGAYLRTRYAAMASQLAARFSDDPAVIAFETYNEPQAVTDAQLLAFNQQVIPAIRAAAPNKLVFFEPSATFDEIGEASLGNGSLGPGTAYSPHVYTLAFVDPDSPGVTMSTYAPANLNALTEAQSWQAPLVITEFGYPPESPNFANWALWQGQLEDQTLASSFFWVWKDWGTWGFFDYDDAGTPNERPAVVAAMARPRLEAAAGRLVSVAYDPTAQTLTTVFDGSLAVTAPNLVSIGAGSAVPAAQWTATCDGKSVATGGSDPLSIACGGPGAHTLVVSAK